MQAITPGFKLIKKIKDERFDEEKLHQYNLLINIGARDFQVAIIDTDDSRLIFFEDYVFSDLDSADELLKQLQLLFEAHPLLLAGFWKKVTAGFKNHKFIQVPAALFIENSARDYLKFNSQFDDKKEIALFNTSKTGAVTVFAVYRNIREWLTKLYANTQVQFIHQSTALIEGVLDYHTRHKDGNPLFIYVDRFKLHLLSIKDGRLIYYNQFIIKQFADYIKYIMLVLNALNMDQKTSKIVLWGYIGKNSPHYHEFVKYIRNVDFGTRPSGLKFGYLFDEVQEHHFFDLFSLSLVKNH